MADYLVLWNAHDAAAIIGQFYRLDGDHPWRSNEGLKAEFDRLMAQGYTSPKFTASRAAFWPDTGQVELRFTRLTTDGGFPPKEPDQPLPPAQVRRWLARHGHERPARRRAHDVSRSSCMRKDECGKLGREQDKL